MLVKFCYFDEYYKDDHLKRKSPHKAVVAKFSATYEKLSTFSVLANKN